MTPIRHIFAKDLRRLRWPLIVWLAVVIARVVSRAALSELAFSGTGVQIAIENVSALLAIIDTLMLVVLVSWLVHDEPLIGPDAFWLTRPIRPTHLMTEKLAFAALFLVGAPAVLQSIVSAIITRTWSDAVRVVPGLFFTQTLWVAVLIALAALTPSLTRFLLTIAGAVAVNALALSVVATVLIMTLADSYRDSVLMDATTFVVGAWLMLVVSLAVIASQYRTRRFKRSLVVAVAGGIVAVLVANGWPWRFAKPAEPDPGAWAHDTARVAVVLDRNSDRYVTDALSVRRGTTPKKQVAVPIRLTGVPAAYAIDSMAVRSRVDFVDGGTLQSAQAAMVPVRREGSDTVEPYDHTTRLQAALAPTRLLPADGDRLYGQWPVVLTVTDTEYERYGRTPGRLTAMVHAFLYESRLVGSIPLVDGAMLRGSSLRFELRRVVRRPDGCSVLMRQTAIGSFGRAGVPRSYQFVLRNAQRGEAVLGDNESLSAHGLQFGGWSIGAQDTSGLAFHDLVHHYPQRSPFSAAAPQIDAAWLDGADLAVIETAYAGRVTRSLTVEGFTIRR